MSRSVSIIGLEELKQKFENMAKVEVFLKQIINKQLLLVQAQAKLLCPVDTGQLRNSINIDVEVKGKNIIGKVFTNCNYGMFVEFGTGVKGNGTYPYPTSGLTYKNSGWCYFNEGENKWIYTTGQPAQPYLYPALKDNEAKILENIRQEIIKVIKG